MKKQISTTLLNKFRHLSGAERLETQGERNLSYFQIILIIVGGFFIFGVQIIDPSTHYFSDLDFVFQTIGLFLLILSSILLRFQKYKLSQLTTILIINIFTLIEVILGIEKSGLFSILYLLLILIISLSITTFWISVTIYAIDLLALMSYFLIYWDNFDKTELMANVTLLLFISIVILISVYFMKKKLIDQVYVANKTQTYFESIFNYVPHGIVIANFRGRISDLNDNYCRIFGYEKQELIGRYFSEITHPDDQELGSDLIIRLLNKEIDHFVLEKRYFKKNGEIIWGLITVTYILDKNNNPTHTIGQMQDITEIKIHEMRKKEEDLRQQQAQKLEAVGILASGIAHDFNNLLGIINGYAEILYSMETEDEHKKIIEEIQKAGEKALTITKQLLTYGRKDDRKLIMVNINHVIHELNNFMNMAIADKKIKIEQELQLDISNIYANTNELSQIMMNLLINAKDAMPEGGQVNISTEQLGESIIITFKDNGVGMDENILAKIFDPYFSTKPKGSGLGLSIVHNILSSIDGKIFVESEVNKGTTFKIELPVYDPKTMPISSDKIPEEIEPVRSKSILLVEDEIELANITKTFLDDTGYGVIIFNDPILALSHYSQFYEKKKYDLVITDVKMESMSGIELVKKIKEFDPNQPILFITGFGNKILENEPDSIKKIPLLQKPFTKYEISKIIQNTLSH